MRGLLVILTLLGVLIIAGAHPGRSTATTPLVACTGVCDGGGYVDLPTCGPARYGQVLYSHGYNWLCISGIPRPTGPGDHWIRVAP